MKRGTLGFSMLEIVVATLIVALAVVPMMGLLSSSSTETAETLYETMARHYEAELVEQLFALEKMPGFRRLAGGNDLEKGLPLDDVNMKLGETSEQPFPLKRIRIGNDPVTLLVTPLMPPFLAREIAVKRCDTGSSEQNGIYSVTVTLIWMRMNTSGADERCTHRRQWSIFVRG